MSKLWYLKVVLNIFNIQYFFTLFRLASGDHLSVTLLLDLKENGNLGFHFETPNSIGKVLRVESLRYIFLVKKEMIKKLNFTNLLEAENLDEMDYLISQELKQNAPLYLLVDQTYGELLNYKLIEEHKSNIEFFRIFENFNLWTKRYIQPQVGWYYKIR